jgi:hypothetical protein
MTLSGAWQGSLGLNSHIYPHRAARPALRFHPVGVIKSDVVDL